MQITERNSSQNLLSDTGKHHSSMQTVPSNKEYKMQVINKLSEMQNSQNLVNNQYQLKSQESIEETEGSKDPRSEQLLGLKNSIERLNDKQQNSSKQAIDNYTK